MPRLTDPPLPYRPDRIPVFMGPSLSGWQPAPPFEPLPPAGAGDMLRLLAGPPCTTVLIDGVFAMRPAVWHKEILLLLARGFRVIGAASMGALRAAELAPLGMIGVGAIFTAYARGQLTGDDEVAVTHAPVVLGSRPLSLAQVDVRATLVAAVRAEVIPVDAARRLRAASAAIHYRDRDWAKVLAADPSDGPDRLAPWLANGAVSLKRQDAMAALALAARLAATPPEPRPAPPMTKFLETVLKSAGIAG